MRMRLTAILAALVLVASASPVLAQVQTGDITGKITDNTGAILPGVTVTLTGATLIQPQTAITQRHRHLQLPAFADRHVHGEVRAARVQDGRP